MFYGADEDEARARRIAWQASEKDTPAPATRGTLGALHTHWLDDVVAIRVRASTLRAYRVALAHMAPLDTIKIDKLTTETIQRQVAEITRTVSPDAAARALDKLRSALAYAVKAGMIKRNPADAVEGPRLTRRKPNPLTAPEAQTFINAIAGHVHEAGFWLSLCGLRSGETCGAPWDAVDWERHTITVRQQAKAEGGTVILTSDLKGKGSARIVHLPELAMDALRRAREHWRQEAVARRPTARDLILASPRGMVLHPATYYGKYAAVLKAAGIPRRRLHDLRHTFATLSIDGGASPRAVQAQLGHTSPDMTFAYTHPTQEGQARAADAYGQILTPKRKAE